MERTAPLLAVVAPHKEAALHLPVAVAEQKCATAAQTANARPERQVALRAERAPAMAEHVAIARPPTVSPTRAIAQAPPSGRRRTRVETAPARAPRPPIPGPTEQTGPLVAATARAGHGPPRTGVPTAHFLRLLSTLEGLSGHSFYAEVIAKIMQTIKRTKGHRQLVITPLAHFGHS